MDLSIKTMKLALPFLLVSICTGCGFLFGDKGLFPDKSQDYKKAREVAAITVPEGEDSSSIGEIYPVPPITDTILLAGEFEVLDSMMKSEDTQEGLKAFLEKRKPVWQAR